MPDITELLDSTTPADVPPVDLADLARRARSRRRRQQAASGAVAILVVTAVAAAIVTRSDDDPDVTVDAGPSIDLTEPVGAWTGAADPPFDARTDPFTAPLSDGRVLVWGGTLVDDSDGVPTRALDGGIYDPDTDEWEPIRSPAPVDNVGDYAVQLENDRMALVLLDEDTGEPGYVAVYDVAGRSWHEAPRFPADQFPSVEFHVAWDGEALGLVYIEPVGASMGSTTFRWQLGEGNWMTGPPAPLAERDLPGTASDDGRLAVWGGSPTSGSALWTNGAIYDVSLDTWETIPSAPIPGRTEPLVMWSNGRVVVGGGEAGDLPPEKGDDLAAFDPTTGDWQELPPAPEAAEVELGSSPYSETDDSNGILTSPIGGGSAEDAGGWWFFDGREWHVGEFHDLYEVVGLVVGTSRGTSDDVPMRFRVHVHVSGDEWAAAAEAPEGLSPDPAVAVAGTSLVVVDPSGTWVLDLTPGY